MGDVRLRSTKSPRTPRWTHRQFLFQARPNARSRFHSGYRWAPGAIRGEMDGNPRPRRCGEFGFRPQRDRQVTPHRRRSCLPHTKWLSISERISRPACDRTWIDRTRLANQTRTAKTDRSRVGKTSGDGRNTCIRQAQNGYVIVLSKCLRRAGDGFCRPGTERSRSLKAKQRTGLVAGFNNTIGEQGELISRREFEDGLHDSRNRLSESVVAERRGASPN